VTASEGVHPVAGTHSNCHWNIAGAVPAGVPVDGLASNATLVPTGTGEAGEYVNTAVGPVLPIPTKIEVGSDVLLWPDSSTTVS